MRIGLILAFCSLLSSSALASAGSSVQIFGPNDINQTNYVQKILEKYKNSVTEPNDIYIVLSFEFGMNSSQRDEFVILRDYLENVALSPEVLKQFENDDPEGIQRVCDKMKTEKDPLALAVLLAVKAHNKNDQAKKCLVKAISDAEHTLSKHWQSNFIGPIIRTIGAIRDPSFIDILKDTVVNNPVHVDFFSDTNYYNAHIRFDALSALYEISKDMTSPESRQILHRFIFDEKYTYPLDDGGNFYRDWIDFVEASVSKTKH